MTTVIDGDKCPEGRDSAISEYRRENGLVDSAPYLGKTLLAQDGGNTLGILAFRNGRIDALYVREGAPADTGERLLRSFMTLKMYEGSESVSIHSLDRHGRYNSLCRRMGFTEDGACSCCQRFDTVCLKMRF